MVNDYKAAKVFSATVIRDREYLGEKVTAWLRENKVIPKECRVLQSSDTRFHCITIIVFY